MPDISLITMVGAVPTSGMVCSAYKASRFGTLPVAYDTAVPSGAADATATSGSAFGGVGQVVLPLPTFEEYWISMPSGGHIGWVKSPSPVVPESDVTALIADLGFRSVKPAISDAVLYVSLNGNDSNDGLSWGSAKLTIQAAINALPTTGTMGGLIELGSGYFALSAAITITSLSNITIQGRGNPATSIVVHGNYDAFTVSGVCVQIVFRNLWVGSFAVRASGYAINVVGGSTHSDHILLENVAMQNTFGGLSLLNVDSSAVSRSEYLQSAPLALAGNGLFMQGVIGLDLDGFAVWSSNGPFANHAIVIDSDCDTLVAKHLGVQNIASGTAYDGIRLTNSLGAGHTGPRLVRVFGGFSENNPGYGIHVLAGRDVRFNGMDLTGNALDGYLVDGGDANIKINDSWIALNGTHGAHFTANTPPGSAISDCEIETNSATSSNTSDGIHVDANVATPPRVVGNASGDLFFSGHQQRYGYRQEAGGSIPVMSGNDFNGNGTGAVSQLSLPTLSIITATLGVGAPAAVLQAGSDDLQGVISFGTGTGTAAGYAIQMTLPAGLARVPQVAFTPASFLTSPLNPYAFFISTTLIYIAFGVAPTASQAVGTFLLGYTITP